MKNFVVQFGAYLLGIGLVVLILAGVGACVDAIVRMRKRHG
jgi:hypothetical protein